MKKSFYLTKTAFFLLVLFFLTAVSTGANTSYRQAQLAEKAGRYKQAVQLYRNAAGDPAVAEAALIQVASIEDNRLNNPPAALKSYNRYLEKFPRGRYSQRAEVRIKHLEPYKSVDLKTWHLYLSITEDGNPDRAIKNMTAFIKENSDVSFLNEARLWLANEYRELLVYGKKEDGKHRDIGKAMALYKTIIAEEKKGRVRLAAMKNLGDCYLIQKDYGEARLWYDRVLAEGGDFGRQLIGKYSFVTDIKTYRNRTVYVIIFLIPLLLGFLAWQLPVKEFSSAGIKMGAKHALMFLPAALFFTITTFMLTDASKDNITGSEPWLVLVIMATTLVTLLFNGLVLEAEERAKILFGRYIASLAILIISIDYLIFYMLDLLHYFEKLFIG